MLVVFITKLILKVQQMQSRLYLFISCCFRVRCVYVCYFILFLEVSGGGDYDFIFIDEENGVRGYKVGQRSGWDLDVGLFDIYFGVVLLEYSCWRIIIGEEGNFVDFSGFILGGVFYN